MKDKKMMNKIIDFDQVIDRKDSNSAKIDLCEDRFGTNDILPMWVADMDFAVPDFILDDLKKRLDHPILGYTIMTDSLYQSVVDWQRDQNNYFIDKTDIIFTHNLVNAIFMAVQAFTKIGDSVLVQTPVYPLFIESIIEHDRKVVKDPLILNERNNNFRYEIDFKSFEEKIITNNVKLFILCNPQNPSGRVWLKPELEELAEICLKHGVTILSDEIHSDLVFPELKHTPIASLSKEVANITVTLNSPGKTFNLGALQIGYAIISNPDLRKSFKKIAMGVHITGMNLFAMIAMESAYTNKGEGDNWKEQMLEYVSENVKILENFFKIHFPKVKIMIPEASYLVWIDFSQMFDDQNSLKEWLVKKAKLGLNDGVSFGEVEGKGFMRMNLAVSRVVLEKALEQLRVVK